MIRYNRTQAAGKAAQPDHRTDRWDIAQQAMDAVNQANLAKSKNYGKIEQQEQNALDSKEVGDTSSQQESAG